MDITITIRIDTGAESSTVVASTGSSGSEKVAPVAAETAGSAILTGTDSRDVDAPPADLLARAHAIGANNAGAAPQAGPSEPGPPIYTGSTQWATLDEASFEEERCSGPMDVSAGAAPATVESEDSPS